MPKLKKRNKIDTAEEIKRQIKEEPEEFTVNIEETLVPTGSTLLNLVLSDHVGGGWQLGKIANLIGDSSSGKTFLALTTMAECCRSDKFADYRLIFDDVEAANEFNIKKLFGKLADAIEPPETDDGEPIYSDTIQQFYDHVLDAIDDGRPFIYILDSLDALDSEEDQKKSEEQRQARKKGTKTAGTYEMSKPKMMSRILRHIKGKLKDTKSLLIIISQVRDNINPLSFEKKKRSGGRALKFYSSHEVWMSLLGKRKRKGRIHGIDSLVKCTKNKITGKIRDCSFPIYYDYGIDDIGSMIDFLVSEGHWKKKKNSIDAAEFDQVCTRAKLIEHIEKNSLEEDLKQITGQVWQEIEKSLELKRKRRF